MPQEDPDVSWKRSDIQCANVGSVSEKQYLKSVPREEPWGEA